MCKRNEDVQECVYFSIMTWLYVPPCPHTQGMMTLYNSNLSEFAVLGFELGYSQANPMSLGKTVGIIYLFIYLFLLWF